MGRHFGRRCLQQVGIQLSHNAVAGQGDLAIILELYDVINDVAPLHEFRHSGRVEPA